MKDFHDLYSLVRLGVLDDSLAGKAIHLVFHHRKTSLKKLPIASDKHAFEMLEKNWSSYCKKLQAKRTKKGALQLPESIEDLIFALNQWLSKRASF